MIAEDYVLGLQSPGTCGKRPRSPVDKLADLAAVTDDDEQDWRSSKRYLTEVIANGFSRLSFNRTGPQQQQQPASLEPEPTSLHSHAARQQPALLPGQLTQHTGQLLTEPLQLTSSCCPMDMQLSPTADACSAQQVQQQLPNSACAATSTGCKVPWGLCGSWPLYGASAGHEDSDRQQAPPGSPPSPECQLVMSAAGTGPPAPAAAAADLPSHAATAVPESAGSMAQQETVGSRGASGSGHIRPNSLPPLQTAKVLRVAEKQPNSPSDLPAASLRKVALLRSLLARAEQQVQQQQGTGQMPLEQQQQQLSRMQQTGMNELAMSSRDARREQLTSQQDRQQHVDGRAWRTVPGSIRGPPHGQQQQHMHDFAPRPVISWDMSSDDMECSSNSSFLDSDGSSSQQGALEAGSQLARPDQGTAGAVLLCQEVLGLDDVAALASAQQQHKQGRPPARAAARTRPDVQLPFCSQHEAQHLAKSTTPAVHPGQQQQLGSSMRAHRQSSPELNLQELDALRAKALATSSQLTCSTQEDLHSLQVGLASRRGSCDSHAPSGLQQVSGRGCMPADLRRRTLS